MPAAHQIHTNWGK